LLGDATEPRSLQEHHAAAFEEPLQARLTFDASVGAAGGPAA
jgi:hypothetical protein